MKSPVLISVVLVAALAAPGTSQQPLGFYDINAYRDIYLTFPQTNYWSVLTANYSSQTQIPATLVVDGVTYPNVGVRFRGNTSYTQLPPGSQKKSFNIRLDFQVAGQDIMGYDHINLNNGFHDPTFLREFLSYWVMRQYGAAPGANFVRLWLRDATQATYQYWGVYINVQQPNKDFAKEWWPNNDGNRYRGFPESGSFANGRCALTWLGSLPSSYLSAYQANQGDGVDLMNCCDILNNTPQASLENALPVILSVDSFYRYAAVMNILTNTDSYIGTGKDHYLYHDTHWGQFHFFPFDLNEAMLGSSTLSMWSGTTDQFKPCFSKTIPIQNWRQRYIAHYRTIAEDTMNTAVLGTLAQQFHAMIAADVAADTRKVYSTTAFQQNLTQTVTVSGQPSTLPGLLPLITARDTFLSALPDLTVPRATLTNLQHLPAVPLPGQQVTVTVQATTQAASLNLWRRTAGPFTSTPMFDDGLHGDGAAGDGVWGAFIGSFSPGALVEYYAASATSAGTLTFLPKTAEHRPASFQVSWPVAASPIEINEFLASNGSVVMDPSGEFEDLVELFNNSNAPVNVGGMYLTDDLLQSTKWAIPAGTTIPAFGTLTIWCDEDSLQPGLHANFKLSSSGEAVALFAADGVNQYDAIVFGPQTTDVSTGRVLDGLGPWATFPVPTPNARNELPSCGSRRYNALLPSAHTMTLGLTGTPAIGTTSQLDAAGGPSGGTGLLLLSAAPASVAVPGTNLTSLTDLGLAYLLPIGLSASGTFTLSVPIGNDPGLVGARAYLQVAAIGTGAWQASNALEIVICP